MLVADATRADHRVGFTLDVLDRALIGYPEDFRRRGGAGLREGLDDVKYASALRLHIEKASRADSEKLKAQAAAAQKWLEDLDLNTADLDAVRQAMTERIRQLDQGLQSGPGARSAQ